MAQYFAKCNWDARGLCAAIKKDGSLGWVPQAKANVFASPEEASQAVESAAHKSLDLVRKQGRSLAPWWLRQALKQDKNVEVLEIDQARLRDIFHIDARLLPQDVTGAFELFYARSSLGWLGGPRIKSQWGSHAWHDSFSQAKGFPDRASLDEACRAERVQDYAVLKSSAVFTAVERRGLGGDDVVSAIESACEARDIEGDIKRAASERSQAGEKARAQGAAPRL